MKAVLYQLLKIIGLFLLTSSGPKARLHTSLGWSKAQAQDFPRANHRPEGPHHNPSRIMVRAYSADASCRDSLGLRPRLVWSRAFGAQESDYFKEMV